MKYKLYAIKQKSTGNFLPQSDRTVREGFTKMEPAFPLRIPPRLFTTERAAKCALTWWLKGEVGLHTETDEDWLGHPYTIATGPGKAHPVEGRDADDMEVVPLSIGEEG